MSARTRLVVMSLSAPVIAFAIVGGLLGKVMAREETFQHLKPFDDVRSLISSNYVEQVDLDKVMRGAMRGLTENLDPDSAYLGPEQVKELESKNSLPAGELGIELTRQFYLRILAARDNSPAAKAGLRSGDFIRAINDKPTRDMSAWEGARLLRGAPGSKVTLSIIRGNAADPHTVELTRETMAASDVRGRITTPGIGYLRVAAIGGNTVSTVKTQIADLQKAGATKLLIDVRRTSTGDLEQGLALAKLFVGQGTLAIRERSANARETVAAAAGDGAVALPALVLVDNGTTGAAELFASAVLGNKRADLVGEHTIGRVAVQRLVKLPDNSGLWLSTARYLTPSGNPLHERGLEPTLAVDDPDVEFGQAPPAGDPILEKAVERITAK